ncbi:hypothetical protein Tcan_05214 [Toxocara canis]|uniref:Uncharacterized protein n=1 Tax=Toxocara canis TaxID=6265 RepID=A0A0B2VEL5_TOXCA|nr:hypothetical protein Tcan_05214 [Toxocara canis]
MDSDAYFCNDPSVLNDCDLCVLADHRLVYLQLVIRMSIRPRVRSLLADNVMARYKRCVCERH